MDQIREFVDPIFAGIKRVNFYEVTNSQVFCREDDQIQRINPDEIHKTDKNLFYYDWKQNRLKPYEKRLFYWVFNRVVSTFDTLEKVLAISSNQLIDLRKFRLTGAVGWI